LLLVRAPGGEPVLQLDVPELADRAGLTEDASLAGISQLAAAPHRPSHRLKLPDVDEPSAALAAFTHPA